MKKRTWVTVLIVMMVLSVSCFVFWRQGHIEHAKMADLCQGSICRSLESFKEYSVNGDDYLYTYGVAEFRSFMSAYLYLNDNSSDPEYLDCNVIYGDMALNPQKVQANMQEIVEALAILADDYTDRNGYIRLNELANLFRHAEE